MKDSLGLQLLKSDNKGVGFANGRGVFRALSNIWDEAFYENS